MSWICIEVVVDWEKSGVVVERWYKRSNKACGRSLFFKLIVRDECVYTHTHTHTHTHTNTPR